MTPPADWTRPAVGDVLKLHAERQFCPAPGRLWSVCVECRQAFPCATVQAITARDPLSDENTDKPRDAHRPASVPPPR